MPLTPRTRRNAAAAVLAGLLLSVAAPASARVAARLDGAVQPPAGPAVAAAAAVQPLAAPAPARPPVRPAPALVPAVRDAVGTGLVCDVLAGLRLCSHGDDAQLGGASTARGGTGAPPSSAAGTRIGCYSSGPRVQTVYARPAGSADRFAASLPSFRGWAGAVERTVDESARKTKGTRHVRFVTTPSGDSCTLSVLRLTLPREAFTTFAATVKALRAAGLDSAGGKYLVWADTTGYCGVASTYQDDTPGQGNLNNGRLPTYARVDRSCWGKAEAHELMHMLGAVQQGAPHATQGMHCRDGSDVMCYDDRTRGSKQSSVCPSAHSRLLDCRGDDYFSTAPAAGSWLASHWNTASSAFLARGWTTPAAAPAPPRPSPASSPTRSPSPRPGTTPSPSPSPTHDPQPEPRGGLLPLLPRVLPTGTGTR